MGARGEDVWLINGPKSWCTFAGRADVLALLARSNSTKSGQSFNPPPPPSVMSELDFGVVDEATSPDVTFRALESSTGQDKL